jgi:hypothetical protein
MGDTEDCGLGHSALRERVCEAGDFNLSDTKESLLLELAGYEAKLTGIQNRFRQTREGIWIANGDSERLLQIVRELCDLLNSALGKPNDYSRQIFCVLPPGHLQHVPVAITAKRPRHHRSSEGCTDIC